MPPISAAAPVPGQPVALQSACDVSATVFTFGGAPPPTGSRAVAVEAAVNVVYGTVPYAVMMLTPADLEDFAAGFSLTEGVIGAREDLRGVTVVQEEDGMRLVVDLVPSRFHGLLSRRRAMAGRTSCGVCGIEDLANLPRAGQRQGPAAPVRLAAIRRALGELSAHQVLNQATRAVHAAAWAGPDGAITCVREDVGRHNALDKLIGALLTRGEDPGSGFLLVTSRCSYEMVEKAAAFGAGTLAAISAPTSLGVERAQHHGITLVGVARHDAVTAFTGASRIICDERILA